MLRLGVAVQKTPVVFLLKNENYLRLKFDQLIKREASQLRGKRKALKFYSTKENRFELEK